MSHTPFFYFLIYHLSIETKIPTITKFVSCYAVIYCIEIKYNVQKNMMHILRPKVLCLQKKVEQHSVIPP